MCPVSPSSSKKPWASNARGRGKSCPPSATTRSIPTCRRAMPRRCANGRRWGSLFDIGSSRLISSSPRTAGSLNHRRPRWIQDDDQQSFRTYPTRRRDERNCAHARGPRVRRDDVALCIGRQTMTSHLRPGVFAALAVLALDQASKLWLLFVFDLAHRGAVKVTPFLDLVLAWNVGISFGWFQNDSQVAQIALMLIKAAAVIVLAIWMARSRTLIATIALGLIIGGAIGNAIDRFAYGAVVDFALFHVQIGGNTFNWYVFNFADVAIVAGGAALLYDSFLGVPAAKAP